MPTGQTSVANNNIRSIVHVVQSAGSVSRREVSLRTGLSTPTVTRHVNELVAAGVLSSSSPEQPGNQGPGRPAGALELDPTYGRVVGVDIGEHTIRAAVADFAGDVIGLSERPTMGREGREASLRQLVAAIEELLDGSRSSLETKLAGGPNGQDGSRPSSEAECERRRGDSERLLSVVIGVPGMVEVRRGLVLDAPNLRGWRDFGLVGEISERTGLQGIVQIENDVNLAALGESAKGAAKGSQDFVFVSIRRGIGAGIFVNGRLLRGHAGMAGELGFMGSDPSFDYRAVDGLGHLETMAGEQALLERAAQEGGERWAQADPEATIRDLCAAVRDGEPAATAIMDEAFLRYGVAAANIVSLLDPELIVVGGDITLAGEAAIAAIRDVVSRLVPHAPEFRCSALGDRAALQGALYQAHTHACDTLPDLLEPKVGG